MQSDLMRPFALINNGLLFVNTYYVYMFLFLFCNVKVNPKAEWNVIEAQISVRVVAAISENLFGSRKSCNSWRRYRMSTSISFMFTLQQLCLRIIPAVCRENARADVFSTFLIPSL